MAYKREAEMESSWLECTIQLREAVDLMSHDEMLHCEQASDREGRMVSLMNECAELERENQSTLKQLAATSSYVQELKRSDVDLRDRLKKTEKVLKQQVVARENAAAAARLQIQKKEKRTSVEDSPERSQGGSAVRSAVQ